MKLDNINIFPLQIYSFGRVGWQWINFWKLICSFKRVEKRQFLR